MNVNTITEDDTLQNMTSTNDIEWEMYKQQILTYSYLMGSSCLSNVVAATDCMENL